MSDPVDHAQEREQLDRERALKAHQDVDRLGRTHCQECNEAISALRQSLGAMHCVMCQSTIESEHKKRDARICV